MKYRRKRIALCLCLIFLIGVVFWMTLACEPALPLEVTNKTDQSLTIHVNNTHEFEVAPGKVIKKHTVPMIYSYYSIEARNTTGEVVYFKKFSWDELHDTDFKIVNILNFHGNLKTL